MRGGGSGSEKRAVQGLGVTILFSRSAPHHESDAGHWFSHDPQRAGDIGLGSDPKAGREVLNGGPGRGCRTLRPRV